MIIMVMITIIMVIMIIMIIIINIMIIPFGYPELKPWLGDRVVLPRVLELLSSRYLVLTSRYLVLAYWYYEHSEP